MAATTLFAKARELAKNDKNRYQSWSTGAYWVIVKKIKNAFRQALHIIAVGMHFNIFKCLVVYYKICV